MSKKQLMLTKSMLEQPKKLNEVFDLQPFQDNFIKNYAATTGKEDGGLVWEREKVLFMKKISENKKIEECTRLSIYSSFIELAVSGLTLYDDQCYIIPYGGVATFQIGYKGRFEQIARLPQIEEIGQATVVYESDVFDYALGGLTAKIIKHERTKSVHSQDENSDDYDPITHVYCVYKKRGGELQASIMEAHEVLAIRDNFSKSYQYYVKNEGKGKGANGKTWDLDPPMWITHPEEAFKKTLIKRIYKQLPKSQRQLVLDSELADRPDVEDTQYIDYGVVEDAEPDKEEKPVNSIKDKPDLGNQEESF